MPAEIHHFDEGTVFEAQLVDGAAILPLTAALTRELLFQKPDGTLVTKPAVLSTDGTDGKMEYVSEPGFLDQTGIWRWQPYVVFAAGEWHGDTHVFAVVPNLG